MHFIGYFWKLKNQTTLPGNELPTQSNLFRSEPVGQEAIVPDFHKLMRQHMHHKSVDELVTGDGHDLLLAITIIQIPEGNMGVGNISDSVIGNSDPVCVSPKIFDHMIGTFEDGL